MKEERQSTTSEKITAAAAVATAATAAKTAFETTKARQEMEAMNRAIQLSAQNQERIQLAMASEQAETNFRNTVLATLPLLKSEKERIQFLTEQFVPKLKTTKDEFVYFPAKWIILLSEKHDAIKRYLEGETGKELKNFLSEERELAIRRKSCNERAKEIETIRESLTQRSTSSFGVVSLVKLGFLWAFLYLIVYMMLNIAGI